MPANQIVPMTVAGVRFLVERAYRESGELQYLRELLVNALEAGASRVEFGPEWNAVEAHGVYRLTVADNGNGMNPAEMLKFLNTFGGGGKPIGDAHENFGVGAKTSLLPWNGSGVVVLSWTKENPDGAMVWMMRDSATGEYGAKKFETEDGFQEVVVPFGEWSRVKPDWIKDQGTVVVCLGTTGSENTFLGKTGNGDIKGIAAYLNKRIWAVPDGIEIHVQELRTQKQSEWPRSITEATGPAGEPDRRWNRRRIRGSHYYATTTEGGSGQLGASCTVSLTDGTEVDWFLWEGDRPKVHSYAHMNGVHRSCLQERAVRCSGPRSPLPLLRDHAGRGPQEPHPGGPTSSRVSGSLRCLPGHGEELSEDQGRPTRRGVASVGRVGPGVC